MVASAAANVIFVETLIYEGGLFCTKASESVRPIFLKLSPQTLNETRISSVAS